MTPTVAGCLTIVSAVSLPLAVPCVSSADDAVVVTSTASTADATIPDPYFLRSGLLTLGASYVPAVAVAMTSETQGDDHLYVPVAGPWLDLADREDCDGECGGENVDKTLLVTSGVLQSLGALQIVGSFIFQETTAVTVSDADGTPKLSFKVTPAGIARGSGVVATGKF